MARTSIGVGGVYKELVIGTGGNGTAIGAGGAWKSVQGMWIGASGAWKLFFGGANALGATLSGLNFSGGLATTQYRTLAAGTTETQETPSGFTSIGTWLLAGAASDYEARMTKQSGTLSLSTGSEATWQGMNTTLTYGIEVTGGFASGTYVGLYEIRTTSGLVLDSATVDMTVESTI